MERLPRRSVSTPQRTGNNPETEIVIDLNRNRGPKLVSDNNIKYNVMVSTTGLRRNQNVFVGPIIHLNEHGNYQGAIICLH